MLPTRLKFIRIFLLPIVSLFFSFDYVFGVKNFVLIAAPGSGKGTFSQYMVEKHGYVQICPGDIFRNEIARGTELGKQIQPIVDRGDYVDENIVCTLIEQYMREARSQNQGIILDGFPRSAISFDFLHSLVKKSDFGSTICFLQFIASDEVCTQRIISRLVCTSCFRVYNNYSKQPVLAGICDRCRSALSLRKADTEAIAQKRLEYFHSDIEPLMEIAQKHYHVRKIDSECSLDTLELVYEKLLEE